MPVYRIGDSGTFALRFKVLRVFGYRDNIYYIVEILQEKVPWRKGKRILGALDFNGSADIPEIVRQKTDVLITEIRNQNPE